MQNNGNLKAIALGSIACVFFSSTYILNSFLSLKGGHWAWTAGMRSFFLMLLLVMLLAAKGQLRQLLWVMRQNRQVWLLWGGVAFGVSYLFLTFAASFGPGWLIAGVFQFTIVAGILLSPFLYKDHRAKIPFKALLLSLLIMVGIAFMQWSQKNGSYTPHQLWWCVGLVLLAAFTWPLANRKLLLYVEESGHPLSAIQRVAGTAAIGSLPFQLVLMAYGYYQAGLPNQEQLLAAVEATQSIEILVTVIGEVLLLGIPWPNWIGNMGMLLVVFGLVLYSIPSRQKVLQIPKAMGTRHRI
ncbi:hypothetical protein DXT99_20465 [Pontibacter diazotrophicus]|uniref:Multidrug resistance efflux transporter family protein n=1 Tax=Pontibacter diazotrophicus TaxID=1400979 RepID=A0A3D8L7A4_9BACT|nr:multidrug resistance efflux transporter family protein [Pontibacter diazotrophicus]RDV13254.1 hypothetical protein DXT99_20465 [Pontibacter diazotrophicus]